MRNDPITRVVGFHCREGGKDTSVQRGRHKDGSQRESGACEGEEDTTAAPVQSKGGESHDERSEDSSGTSDVCGA